MKMHPLFQKYLKGGKVIQYGAKTAPLGGFHSIPKLYADGLMLAGDSCRPLESRTAQGRSSCDQERHARR